MARVARVEAFAPDANDNKAPISAASADLNGRRALVPY